MRLLDIRNALEALLHGVALPLTDLPRRRGVYALIDHTGETKYIGKADRTNFADRINNRHTTGSEANSHKFSHTYNTGRMWRAKNDDSDDARKVKSFRTAFIRHYCRARVFEIDADPLVIEGVESQLRRIAPSDATEWNDKRVHTAIEPENLVNELLTLTKSGPSLLAAMERQQRRFLEQSSQ